jgi:hypothetical protein
MVKMHKYLDIFKPSALTTTIISEGMPPGLTDEPLIDDEEFSHILDELAEQFEHIEVSHSTIEFS